MNTQLVNLKKYNPNKSMIFLKPETRTVQGNNKIQYKIVNIITQNINGTKGDLVLPTCKLFSFGCSVNNFKGKENGYTFPLCLWNKKGPSEEELKFIEVFQKIVDCCIDHIIESVDFIEDEDSRAMLSRKRGGMDPLYYPKNEKKNKRNSNKKSGGPVLYLKFMFNQKIKSFILIYII